MKRVVNQSILYDKQQNIVQDTIPDRTSIVWDLEESQNARLEATTSVGNTRTILNTTLEQAVPGGKYTLTFVQDSVGGRNLDFEDGFELVGDIDVTPGATTVMEMYIVEGKGKVFVKGSAGNSILRNPLLVLDANNWVANLETSLFEYTVSDENITNSTVIEFIPHQDSTDEVIAAEIQPFTPVSEGQATIFAKTQPSVDINVELIITPVENV